MDAVVIARLARHTVEYMSAAGDIEREGVEAMKPRYERVHGRYERVELHADEFVKLSQVRRERNRVSDELKADILSQDLINSVDVAHVDEGLLLEYLSFVQRVWGSSAELPDFDMQRRSDGTYYLLIAGHSRHQVIEELEQEDLIPRIPIEAKVHKVTSIWDIIKVQIGENISSTPPKERRAMALVEAYEHGKAIGMWEDEEEFIASDESGDASLTSLQEAQSFSHLPPEVRNLAFDGTIPFSAGVEIGKSVRAAREFVAVQYHGDVSAKVKGSVYEHVMGADSITQEVKDTLNTTVGVLLWELVVGLAQEERRQTVEGAHSYIVGQRMQWRGYVQKIKHPGEIVPEITMEATPDDSLRIARKRLTQSLRILARVPGSRASSIIDQSGWLISEKQVESLLSDLEGSLERAKQHVGMRAAELAGATHTVPDTDAQLLY